jgi:GNAT superfamily N-acetyltransferase
MINTAYSYQDAAKGRPHTTLPEQNTKIITCNFYVLTQNAGLIGCVYTEHLDQTVRFGLLTVITSWRKRGVAQALITSIENYARHPNARSVVLDYMSVAQWLSSYYERLGCRETGDTTSWGTVTLIHMEKVLHNTS